MGIRYPLIFIDDTCTANILTHKDEALSCIEYQFISELDVSLFDIEGNELTFICQDKIIVDIKLNGKNDIEKMKKSLIYTLEYLAENNLERNVFSDIPEGIEEMVLALQEVQARFKKESFRFPRKK